MPLPATAHTHDVVPEVVLRTAGLRVTDSRRAVMQALADQPHASADQLLSTIQRATPDASMQSVYNAVTDFERAGIVRRIEPAGHPGRFELRVGDNHHHLVCRQCGQVEDIDCVVGGAPCLDASNDHGYVIDEAEVTFWGVCSQCVGKKLESPQASKETHE